MRYPAERKEAILKKMAPPMSMTIPELAEQEGITATTCPAMTPWPGSWPW